ncbi:MAG: CoA-binding protein [Candidatus Lokiarchaeota archaeon]|nr:CoA-binding protein [Candidatus Lokiarchaeota archaeon]
MSDNNIIHTFLNPKSVAVIGASKNPLKGGNRIVHNLVSNNFEGKIFPINPNSKGEVFGLEFRKSVLDIEEDVDLAIFYVPNHVIPKLLEDCINKGIKGAIIEASGFEEVGDLGLHLRDDILTITDNFKKIRIVGPNCMGLTRIDIGSKSEDKRGFFTSFGIFSQFNRGNIGIISQSGMLNGGYLMHVFSQYPNIGFRYSCSIGNKMDLGENEFLEYFINDPTVNVIAVYLESFKEPRKFLELCKKLRTRQDKTIILVKGGVTSLGQKASHSHTGTLSENSRLINAIIKQAGVIPANSFHELFQYSRTLSMMYKTKKKFPIKGNASMVAGSGGAGTITADLVKKHGLNFPVLSEKTYETLLSVFPEWMPPNKFALVDIWPAMEKAMMNNVSPQEVTSKVYRSLMEDPEIEGVFNMLFCSNLYREFNKLENVIDEIRNNPKPFFFWLIGDNKEVQRVSRFLSEHDLPDFPSLEEMVKNFQILVQEAKNKRSI